MDVATVAGECRRLKKAFIRSIPGVQRELLMDYFGLHYTVLTAWCEGVTHEPVIKSLDDLLLFMETYLSVYLTVPEYLIRYRAKQELLRLPAGDSLLEVGCLVGRLVP